MALLVTKILPALAGSYIRNLFPPRKPILQRFGEMIGGVLMVIYAGKVAAGGLWATLGWLLGMIGTKPAEVIDRADANFLAAFLVGLLGMTVVEGMIAFLRAYGKSRADAA